MKATYRLLWLMLTGILATSTAQAAAAITLSSAGASVTQTSDAQWLLEKVGAVNGGTVTWVIGATELATTTRHLAVVGHVTVTNTGSEPATIGNIVVNLQTRLGNKWVTRSSDVANATDGDDATTALVVKSASSEALSSFTENAASGSLNFMDATNNTAFSLVPQQLIAPGATVPLLFSATFDNTVLNLAVGTTFRAEVIVTFGNSGGTNYNNTAPDIDINGNGTIDADEARVRSVPTRLTLKVPATQQGNVSVVLTDTIDDIATTGTVTVTSSSFSLGATTGTVTVGFNAGASGGTITNCAHLDSASTTTSVGAFTFPTVDGVDLDACDTQTIPGPGACTPGVGTCGWVTGSRITYSQSAWGNPFLTNPTLFGGYDTVYGAGGTVEVGLPGLAGYSMSFTLPLNVTEYLPAIGTAGPLNADLVNPTSSASGLLGGEILGLQLNVDFADAGVTTGTSSVVFGDLTMCNIGAPVDGIRVRDFLALANTALGGGSTSGISYDGYGSVASALNSSFVLGEPSSFAQQSLRIGSCGWSAGSFVTYSQVAWGNPFATNPTLFGGYDAVYGTGSEVEVGIPGAAGFSMTFTLPLNVSEYLPAIGISAPLNADLLDPTSSASGQLGGEVLGLQLNVDFADAGITAGTSSVAFGDLTLCNVGAPVDGISVRAFLALANTALGGGSTSGISYPGYTSGASALNNAFVGGTPSQFAQESLVIGSCP